MVRLPPAEKLPLLLRKNLRDEWDANKDALEAELSEILGTPWSLKEINPSAIWPYADDGYAKESLGSCIAQYVRAVNYNLKRFVEQQGEDGKAELNRICHEHALLMDVDDRPEGERVLYSGARFIDGKLVIAFAPGRLGTNIDDTFEPYKFVPALDAAPQPEGADGPAFSYAARAGIKTDYEEKIEPVRARIAAILGGRDDIKLVPNFEENYAKLSAAAAADKDGNIRDDWAARLGYLMHAHFEGLQSQLEYQGFEKDDLLQEGLNEVLETGEFRFRIQDALKKGTYSEPAVEDGAVYINATPKYFGVNVHATGEGLVDLL